MSPPASWLQVGQSVSLIRPSSINVVQAAGRVLRVSAGEFILGLDEKSWDIFGRCVFSLTQGDLRCTSVGFAERLTPERLICRPVSPWQEIATDRRASARYPSALKAAVKGEQGATVVGTVVNLSEGGCAVATQSDLEGTLIELTVQHNSYSARLRCRRVGASLSDDGRQSWLISHLQFDDMSPADATVLKMLLDQHEAAWSHAG